MGVGVKSKRATMAFYLFFLMLSFAKGLSLGGQSKIYNIIFLCSLVFLMIKMINTKYSRLELVSIVVLVMLGVFFVLHARENTPLFAVLAIIGMKDVNFYDLMKKTIYVRIASVVIVKIASEYGILSNVDPGKLGPDGMPSYTWGYSDPNTLMVNIFIILALLLYINYERLNVFYFVGTLVFIQFVLEQSNSRTGYLLFVLLWSVILCDKMIRTELVRRIMYNVLSFVPIVIVVATFVLGIIYQRTNPVLEAINQAVTGRLFVVNHYIGKFPCTLFGNPYEFWLENAGEILAIVDNLYVVIYLYCGVFALVLYVGALYVSMRRMVRLRFYPEVIIVSIISIYAFMEEFPLNPIVNPFGLLLAMALFQTNVPGSPAKTNPHIGCRECIVDY